MKSLLNEEAFEEIKKRIEILTENSERGWGNVLALPVSFKISHSQ